MSLRLLGPPCPQLLTGEGGRALGPRPGLTALIQARRASPGPIQPGWRGHLGTRPQAPAPHRDVYRGRLQRQRRSCPQDSEALPVIQSPRGPRPRPQWAGLPEAWNSVWARTPRPLHPAAHRGSPRPAHQGHPPGQQQLRLAAQSPEVVDHVQDTAAGQPLREPEHTPCSRPAGSGAEGGTGRARAPRRSWACCTRGPWPWSWR